MPTLQEVRPLVTMVRYTSLTVYIRPSGALNRRGLAPPARRT